MVFFKDTLTPLNIFGKKCLLGIILLVYKRWQSGDHVRNIASRDEYVPQHGSRYKTKGTSSRGLAGARIRVRKIAAIGDANVGGYYPRNYR